MIEMITEMVLPTVRTIPTVRIATLKTVVIIMITLKLQIILHPLRAFRRSHLGDNVFGGSLESLWALWALDIGSM